MLSLTATVNMHNSKAVNKNRSTFVPNHVEISLSRKDADFVYNCIESDLAIHPLGNCAIPTNLHTLKQKITPTNGDVEYANGTD